MAFVNVQGKVAHLFASGGFALEESWESKWGTKRRRWRVFPKGPYTVTEGQEVKVRGQDASRIERDESGEERVWKGQDGKEHHSIDFVVSNATVDRSGKPTAPPVAAQQPQVAQSPSGWGNEPSTGGWAEEADGAPF